MTREQQTRTKQDELKVKNAVLVYQGGIANVFACDHISEVSERRGNCQRLLQADFRTCEAFTRGLAAAGCQVASMYCNMAGDIANLTWSDEVYKAPFFQSMRLVGYFVGKEVR